MITIPDALVPRLSLLREPHGVYCTAQDNLRILSWCSAASVTLITITGRFLTVDGDLIDLSETFAPATDRTMSTAIRALGEGWLLDLSIVTNGSPIIGQAFVRAEIVRGLLGGLTALKVLCQGRCNAVQRLAFPNSPISSTIDGPGILRSVAGTNQAAGAEISETVPTGARWELVGLSFVLVTSAAVANREVSIVIDDGTTTLFTSPSGFTHAASLTRRYSADVLGAQTAPTQGTDRQIVIAPMTLLAGWRIRTVTTALDVGDDFGAPQLQVKETLEAAA